MTSPDDPVNKTPAARTPKQPASSTRARPGGAARPIPNRTSTRQPANPAARASRPVPPPPAPPPSFAPGASKPRPGAGEVPVAVGKGTPPAAKGLRSHPTPVRSPSQQPVQGPPAPTIPARVRVRPPIPLGTTTSENEGPPRPPTQSRRFRIRARHVAVVLALLLALMVAWPVGLLIWANGKIQHVSALSGSPDTPGTTYLLAGSDARGDEGGIPDDGTTGARTDTIMVLHVPESGPSALISLPRDSYVEIPGYESNKINTAYAWGGPPLLVQTVEQLTGLHIDHYAEISLGGVAGIVDAVGGVELCMDPAVNLVDYPVNDADSGMVWDAPGCKVLDGDAALSFARMRKSDLEYDVGRAKRQQQLIAAVSSTAADPSLAVRPSDQISLTEAALGAITVSDETNIIDMAHLALAFRDATGTEGIRGTPPISNIDYRPGNVGSTVQLDPDQASAFWAGIRDGTLPVGAVGGIPQP